jgi:predicted metalloendopeptidase
MFGVKIGYPDKWIDYSTLVIDRGPYILNVLRANDFNMKRDLAKIGKPVDRTVWGMTPPTVNAYYNPNMNEIVFPAGILQPPFYSKNADDAVNYGGIGAVIGHEMTHGFDDQGRQYDGKGNLADWWSAESKKRFTERSAVLGLRGDRRAARERRADPGREHRRPGRHQALVHRAHEDPCRQARDEGRRFHARAALLPELCEHLA